MPQAARKALPPRAEMPTIDVGAARQKVAHCDFHDRQDGFIRESRVSLELRESARETMSRLTYWSLDGKNAPVAPG